MWETHPVTPDRFEDFADVINPNRRASHCWCLSHRLRAKDIEELGGGSREQAARAMFEKAGFRVIGVTDAVASRLPRLVMRRDLVGL